MDATLSRDVHYKVRSHTINYDITQFRSEVSNIEPSSSILEQVRSSPISISSIDEDEISIDSNDGSSTMEADVVEIDFVLGSRGDMRLLSRAKKRRLRVKRKACKHKHKSTGRSKKLEAQKLLEQKIIQVCISIFKNFLLKPGCHLLTGFLTPVKFYGS